MKLFKRSKASNFIFEYFSEICRENSSSLKFNNKLINPKLICAFCWFVLFFNYENARSKKQKQKKIHSFML